MKIEPKKIPQGKPPKLRIAVFASKKVQPAFELLAETVSVQIDFTDWSLSPARFIKNIARMRDADLVYFHSPTNLRIIMMPFARLLGKPIMLQWIGTDVLTVTWRQRKPFRDIGLERNIAVQETLLSGLEGFARRMVQFAMNHADSYISFLKRMVTHHVACAPHLAEDLAAIGIKANYLPVLIHIKSEPLPIPEQPALLSYIGFHSTSDTRAFYGWHSLLRLAHDFPDLIFYVVGRGHTLGEVPPNIVYLGYVADIQNVLVKVTGLLRITYHDGMPRMVLEAMAKGRYVIYSHEFPHTINACNYEELRNEVERLRYLTVPNLEGMNYILEKFNISDVANQFVENFHTTLKKSN